MSTGTGMVGAVPIDDSMIQCIICINSADAEINLRIDRGEIAQGIAQMQKVAILRLIDRPLTFPAIALGGKRRPGRVDQGVAMVDTAPPKYARGWRAESFPIQ